MRVISVQQPWAQLIIDRRRRVLLKDWKAEPGERFAIHANHVRNDALSREWYKDGELDECVPKNAIVGLVEVRKCLDRSKVRESKFDVSNSPSERKYAIVVRVIEKYRKPIQAVRPRPRKNQYVWNYEVS